MSNRLQAQHYILIITAIVAALWFFMGYPSQDPRSAVNTSLSQNEVETIAIERFSELGYAVNDYTLLNILMVGDEGLLDSLQAEFGRQKAVDILKTRHIPNIKPYVWQAVFEKKGYEDDDFFVSNTPNRDCEEGTICLQLDMEGQLIGFRNPSQFMPETVVNRNALGSVFVANFDSLHLPFVSVSDSLLVRLLSFDMQKQTGSYSGYTRKSAGRIQSNLLNGEPYRYSRNDAQALAAYYLEKTGWEADQFLRDTVYVESLDAVNAANVQFLSAEPIVGQQLQVEVLVTPAGALLQINSTYNPGPEEGDSIWEFALFGLFLIFAIAVFIVFLLRLRARAIDISQALFAAVGLGFLVIVFMLLGMFAPNGILNSAASSTEIIVAFIGAGILCAIAFLGFFVLISAGDSITRQYWPEKLQRYDYLRQGMVFNKPIGALILQSVALAFVLAGVWTFLLFVFPGLYVSDYGAWLSRQSLWAPLSLVVQNAWFSIFLIFTTILVIAGKVYGKWNNYWLAGLSAAIVFGIIGPLTSSLEPFGVGILIGFLFGIGLFLIYLWRDFLTLLLSYFLFLALIKSAGGWIISGSPDLFLFLWVIILFLVLTAVGVFALTMGEEEQKLPQYVPEYVEEHAQEERIKQELQIARRVQQSFLPVETPDIEFLDIAAVCKPANETGGDYYDFIRLDDHRIAVAIGDVSGKGIQAAFYMTFIKGLLHALSSEKYSPVEVLRKANRLFYENADRSTFISLIYGVIDLSERTFTFARAGHNPILHINTTNSNIEELQPDGLGIGLTKDKIFDNKISEIKLSITDDDLFLLYTDGITEALNEIHQFYGTENLTKLIDEHKLQSASTLISVISEDVSRFIGTAKQHDDMTVMAIRFRNSTKDEKAKHK